MIFNFMKHLRDSFPVETFILDGWHDETSDGILVTRTGGIDNHYTDRIDHSIQLRSRNQDRNLAHQKLIAVYEGIRNRFGVKLPAVTIRGRVYPAIISSAIRTMQYPGYLGVDAGGYHQYTFNIMVTIDGGVDTPVIL